MMNLGKIFSKKMRPVDVFNCAAEIQGVTTKYIKSGDFACFQFKELDIYLRLSQNGLMSVYTHKFSFNRNLDFKEKSTTEIICFLEETFNQISEFSNSFDDFESDLKGMEEILEYILDNPIVNSLELTYLPTSYNELEGKEFEIELNTMSYSNIQLWSDFFKSINDSIKRIKAMYPDYDYDVRYDNGSSVDCSGVFYLSVIPKS